MATPRSRSRVPRVEVSREFARDFRYLVWFYDMTEAEAEEWRVLVRGSGEMMNYVATLAMALRCGYRQTHGNNFVRLNSWLLATWRDPITKYTD